jgi:Uma2 family endonuclease
MAHALALALDDSLRIPAAAYDLQGFREWVHSTDFPETGRIDYLDGELEAEMSPEDLHTHGIVKLAVAGGLHALVTGRQIGEAFVDRARVTCPKASLSVEPDAVVVLWETLQAGRVRYVPAAGKGPDRYREIEGAPDIIVEVVSDSSVAKDTRRLPRLYARAGIPELWLVDTRGERLRFEIRVLRGANYRLVEPSARGWLRSPRLGCQVRLTRQRTPIGTWAYSLESRDA